MSEDGLERRIEGLAPRRTESSLARLVKANRDAEPAAERVVPREPVRGVPEATPAVAKVSVTVYLDAGVRRRSKAAYRATGHLEQDTSYSDMVNRAILMEVERREALYNEGRPFVEGAQRLPAGRPLAT